MARIKKRTQVKVVEDDVLFQPSSKKQEMFLQSKAFITVFGGAAMSGKAQPLYSKVKTTSGWKRMSDVEVGDTVITPNKGVAKVLSTHPDQLIEVYEFELFNKVKVRSSTDHMWVFKVDDVQNFGDTNKITSMFLKNRNIKIPVIKRGKVSWIKLKNVTTCGWQECKCISIDSDDHLYITDNSVVTHNTYQGLMRFLWYVDDPLFSGYVVRKNATDFKKGGGAFEEAIRMFKKYDPNMTYTKQPMQITFSSGATINFIGLDGESGMDSIQGIQITCAMIDEATHLTEEEVFWLITRLRATSDHITPCIWLTCNPDPDHFLCRWLEDYYLYPRNTYVDGELVEGRPIPERNGDTRYFVRIGNSISWGSSYDEMFEKHKHLFQLDEKGKSTCVPQSFKFIGATCLDNPKMLEKNPNYVAQLASSPRIKMERLLKGNWFAREEGSGYFKREWVEVVDRIDAKVKKRVRCWDVAATMPSEKNPHPDFTASTMMSLCDDGYYYIEHAVRDRIRINDVIDWIINTSIDDNEYCNSIVHTYIPQDPNAQAKYTTQQWVNKASQSGVALKVSKNVTTKSKLTKFLPFAAVAEAGLVRIVRGEWNAVLLDEMEAFTGERSTAQIKDD